MAEVVVIDIGGTHVRFAIAEVSAGTVKSLGEATTLLTGDYSSFAGAWADYGKKAGRDLPDAIAISFAGPVHGEVLKLTNSPWIIHPSRAGEALGVKTQTVINDFAAVGHAVAHIGVDHLQHICGPDQPLPDTGTISIIGPGTGLGVAHVLKWSGGYHVSETEGGHMDFAPLDILEDKIATALRARFRRVSAERVISGPGLNNIYQVLADSEGVTRTYQDDDLWAAAMGGTDPLAKLALERFFLSMGAFAGDVTLAQGGSAVVIGGGLGFRLAALYAGSGFAYRFAAKGRFETFMSSIPVKLLTHPQPGLLGAAAAYAVEHCS